LDRHKDLPNVAPLLTMTPKEQDRHIDKFRKEAIKNHNIKVVNTGTGTILRERTSTSADLPKMCSGCKGFFSKSYKSRYSFYYKHIRTIKV